MDFSRLNWLAVAAAVVTNMALGYVWYSMPVFGRTWMMLIGKQAADLKKGAGRAMGGMVLLAILLATTIGLFYGQSGMDYAWMEGLQFGLMLAAGVVLPVMMSSALFEGRPMKLFLINYGYQLVSLSLMGVIFGAWPK